MTKLLLNILFLAMMTLGLSGCISEPEIKVNLSKLLNKGPINNPPVLDAISNQTLTYGVAITTINAGEMSLDLDSDGQILTYECFYDTTVNGSVSDVTTCSSLTGVTFSTTTGVLNWTPIFSQIGNYEFKIRASDGSLTDEQIFAIHVTNINHAPVLDAISDQTVNEGVAITTIDAGISGVDTDVDGDTITYSCYYDLTINGAVASTTACSTISGMNFSSSTGVMNWMPNLTQSGTYEFKIVASDGSLSDEVIFSITVNNVNQAPLLDTIADQTVNEGVAITTINAGDGGDDFDRDGQAITYDCYYDTTIDGSVLSVSACTSITGLSFSTSTGVMNWTPNTSQSGTYEFIIIGSDGSLTGSEIFSITVNDTNQAPVLDAIADQTVDANSPITTVDAGDGGDDFDADGDALTYTCYYDTNANGTVANVNACSSLSGATFSASTGVLNWTPSFAQVGQYEFKITASDSSLTGSKIFKIDVNSPPSFISVYRTPSPNTSVTLPMKSGGTFNFTVDWGDGSAVDTITSYSDPDKTHNYVSAGDYTVTITGQMSSIGFEGGTSKNYLIRVTNLGSTQLTDLESAFKDCVNLTYFAGGDTSQVTTMDSMFFGANNLVSIDLSTFDTSNVTHMNFMFYGALQIPSLNLSNFNTANVTTMAYMFYNMGAITSLNVSSFDTSNVTDMYAMFQSTTNLNSLNLSNFDTSKVTDMRWMFASSGVTSLNVTSFDTSRVTTMSYMFFNLTRLTSLNVTSFNTGNVTNMSNMFYLASKLTSLDLHSFDTSKVTNMEYMLANLSEITSLNLSNFDTSSVTSMSNLFAYNSKLTSLNITSFNTSNVFNMNTMFGYSNLASLNLSHFDTSNVINMDYMFVGMGNLTSLNLTGFNTAKVTTMRSMFQNTTALTTLNLSMFDTSKVTKFSLMFYNSAVTNLNLSSFNTVAATEMDAMFQFASVSTLDISNFNTANVTTMQSMFYNAPNLTSLNLSHFNTANVTSMQSMFQLTTNLTSLNTTNWDLTKASGSMWVLSSTNAGLVITCNQGGSPGTGTFFGASCN